MGEPDVKPKPVICYFWFEDGDWVGQSMRYDLRVDATSLVEAKRLLGESVTIFVDEALSSEPSDAEHLLSRHAPISVMAACWAHFAWGLLVRLGRSDGDRTKFAGARGLVHA